MMATPVHGLYINGHGKTLSNTFCFLPPLFTEIAMAENYGRILYGMRCKYSKQPVFAMINDIHVNLIGQLNMLLSDNTTALGFPVMSHTGIAIVNKQNTPDIKWSTSIIKDNLFDFFVDDSRRVIPTAVKTPAYVLRKLDMRLNTQTGDIMADIRVPRDLYTASADDLSPELFDKLMEQKHNVTDSFSPSLIQEAGAFFEKYRSRLTNVNFKQTPEFRHYEGAINRLMYIGYVNRKFLEAVGIKSEDMLGDVHKYLMTDYLAKHAHKLILHKVLHIDIEPADSSQFIDYLHSEKYQIGLSTILNKLKSSIIESRLMESSYSKPFKMWCSTCRGLEPIDERRAAYKSIESVFQSRENMPKSVREFAVDNTRELGPAGEEKFRGLLSPHIVITNILYPCFLYSMDPDTCDLLPEFTPEHIQLFEYMIANLPLYTLDKAKVLRFIELVTPHVVDSMVTSLIWSSVNPGDDSMETYSRIFLSAFNTLTHKPYNYTVEDIVLVYGVVIYNMPTYIDLSAAVYRSPANIHPSEYGSSRADPPETNIRESVGSIWNLPNNNRQTRNQGDNARLEPVMSKKLRRHTNKQARRSKKRLNIVTRESSNRELSGDDLVKVASDELLNGKYLYLTETVKKKPDLYIERLFGMVTRFHV